MQKFTMIDPIKFVSDSSVDINNALNSLLSSNAGTVFPTSNLVEGMVCYRSDIKKVYQLKNVSPVSWVMIADLNADLSVAIGRLLPLTGGTMTGNVSYAMYNSTQIPVKIYGGDSSGQGLSIGAGGATIVGSGESKSLAEQNLAATNEALYLTSDNAVKLISNVDAGWGARKEATFDAGTLTVPGKVKAPLLEGNLTGDVTGSVTGNLRGNVTGTVNGNVTGNANTATRLQTARKINGVVFDGTNDIAINAGMSIDTRISVSGSTESNWSQNVVGSGHIPNGYFTLSGASLTRIAGLSAGTYTLSSLLQNLVNISHKHGAANASGTANCQCACDCDCDCSDDGCG